MDADLLRLLIDGAAPTGILAIMVVLLLRQQAGERRPENGVQAERLSRILDEVRELSAVLSQHHDKAEKLAREQHREVIRQLERRSA